MEWTLWDYVKVGLMGGFAVALIVAITLIPQLV